SDAGAGSIPPAVGGGSDSFAGEHRRIAVFLQPEWGSCAAGELLSAFQADVSGREPVGHRDVLGALMACGVEREAVGEIVAEGATAYFFCLASVARFISGNISKIGRSAASLRAIPAAQVPLAAGAPRAKTVTVASMRLDTLIGEGFGVSRGASAELVRRGMASVNHVACEKPDRKIEPGDLLSVRGKGRLKVVSAGSLSRKGRIFVELGVYG
ncbi:MAG: hypothetical protein LBJ10_01710, partial [Clostridiales bacterium]|nr:hypothetical protein [Clostridiales bacterium]